jgi:hypothetical protein
MGQGGRFQTVGCTLLQENNCVWHMYRKHNNIQIMFLEFQYLDNTNKTASEYSLQKKKHVMALVREQNKK